MTPLSLLAVIAMLADTAAPPPLANVGGPCVATEKYRHNLGAKPIGRDDRAPLKFEATSGKRVITTAYIYDIIGDCAGSISGFDAGVFYRTDNRRLSLPTYGGPLITVEKTAPRAQIAPTYRPTLRGYTLASVDFVEGPNKYVGLWRSGRRSVIATFVDFAGSKPKVLATSEQPIIGVSYVAAPDRPVGMLDVLIGSRNTRTLARYRWDHSEQVW